MAFVAQANCPARPNIIQRQDSDVFTIVILTTSASGGNQSVANAIQTYLAQYKNIRSIVIDSEAIAKETDLIMLATGATTYDGIYATDYQQNNLGMDSLFKRDLVSKELGKYIPSCFGLKLKELVREIRPDLILSTRSYCIDDIPLCTLGVPFRMIHCDYELALLLMDLYGKIGPEMMKFWVTGMEPQFFRPLFVKTNRLDLYNALDSQEILMQKLALITGQPLERIQGQFELFGYPVRSQFYRIEETERLEKLRKKWNLKPNEVPILVSMGRNGVGILEEIFNELSAFTHDRFSVKYFFVCGTNEGLQAKLKHLNSTLDTKNCEILGLLPPEEMNELMNLCPLTISKPGGAFTSEALETGTYLLTLYTTHPWEEANGAKLESLGFGKRLQVDQPLGQQINEQIEKISNAKRPVHKSVPWKELLMDHIKAIRNDHLTLATKEKK